MAEISARIKPKKSSTASEVPLAGDLEVAEIAVNTADGKLFVKHTDNSIKTIGGNVSVIDDLTDVDTSTTPPTDGQILTWVNANSQWEPADSVGAVEEAPQDGNYYVRENGAWVNLLTALDNLANRVFGGGNFTAGTSDNTTSTIIGGGNFTTGTSDDNTVDTIDGGLFS